MHAVAIINPISGARGHPDAGIARADLLTRVVRARGVEVEAHVTAGPGHATELTRAALAKNASVVYAWGGDGTVNEVASVLAFQTVPLAIVPAGSGNGLARALRLDWDPERAILLGLEGATRRIDAGGIAGRLFFNVAGIGFDAHVGSLFNLRVRGGRGPIRYFTLTFREIFSYVSRDYEIEFPDAFLRVRAFLIALANSPEYGLGAVIAPQARLDDGLLDVVIAEARPALFNLARAWRLFNDSVASASGVTISRTASARISSATPMLFHLDGEIVQGGTELEVRVHPGALWVKAPVLTD